MKVLQIAEPFWGAYSIYGWQKPIPGIGIRTQLILDALKNKESILLTIGKDRTLYKISPRRILNLVKKYHSIKKVRYDISVAVIPQNKLEKYE